jgi:hypothetical protein
VQISIGSLALHCFCFELVTLSKNKIENVVADCSDYWQGHANSITPWHEVENFKTILVQSSEAVLWLAGSKHRPTRGGHLIPCMANLLVTLRSSEL